jgi:hypothetical protein
VNKFKDAEHNNRTQISYGSIEITGFIPERS